MDIGQKLQIASGVLAILSVIAGFAGSQLTERGYVETFRTLASDVISAKTRQGPQWTPYVAVDASAQVPPIATFARIQVQLWSDDNTIPLMARIASTALGEVVSEVSGPSAVVEQMLVEPQRFYVSISHPKVHYSVGVLGYRWD
jgi:hypothetical protein